MAQPMSKPEVPPIPTAVTKKKTSFLDLPPELRITVYDHFYGSYFQAPPESEKVESSPSRLGLVDYQLLSALLQSHSVIRKEALPYFRQSISEQHERAQELVSVLEQVYLTRTTNVLLRLIIRLAGRDTLSSEEEEKQKESLAKVLAARGVEKTLSREIEKLDREIEQGLIISEN